MWSQNNVCFRSGGAQEIDTVTLQGGGEPHSDVGSAICSPAIQDLVVHSCQLVLAAGPIAACRHDQRP